MFVARNIVKEDSREESEWAGNVIVVWYKVSVLYMWPSLRRHLRETWLFLCIGTLRKLSIHFVGLQWRGSFGRRSNWCVATLPFLHFR